VLLESAGADGIEETEGPEAIDVAGVFCHLEEDLDVRLGTEVVDLGRLDLAMMQTGLCCRSDLFLLLLILSVKPGHLRRQIVVGCRITATYPTRTWRRNTQHEWCTTTLVPRYPSVSKPFPLTPLLRPAAVYRF
jgi:hypothetical protein